MIKKILFAWTPPIFYFVLIWNISAFPVRVPAGTDKWIHIVEYAVMGFFVARAVRLTWNPSRWTLVFYSTVLATFSGLVDELHQAFVPGRFSSSGDVWADLVGSMLGAMGFILASLLLHRWGFYVK